MTSANQNAYNFNPRLRDAANAPALAWLAYEMEFDARHRPLLATKEASDEPD